MPESQSVDPGRPAVFLDRDGVLNVDHHYVHQPERFEWIPGAMEAVRWLNQQGYLVIVVTNQSGVARGYFPESSVHDLHAWVDRQLASQEAHVDAYYYCPHHPEGSVPEYTKTCNCRKPAPGMILQALSEWSVDISRSYLVGDSPRDVEAAESAGIRGYLFTGGNLLDTMRTLVADLGGQTIAGTDNGKF